MLPLPGLPVALPTAASRPGAGLQKRFSPLSQRQRWGEEAGGEGLLLPCCTSYSFTDAERGSVLLNPGTEAEQFAPLMTLSSLRTFV
jgi:hypothetical protein